MESFTVLALASVFMVACVYTFRSSSLGDTANASISFSLGGQGHPEVISVTQLPPAVDKLAPWLTTVEPQRGGFSCDTGVIFNTLIYQ